MNYLTCPVIKSSSFRHEKFKTTVVEISFCCKLFPRKDKSGEKAKSHELVISFCQQLLSAYCVQIWATAVSREQPTSRSFPFEGLQSKHQRKPLLFEDAEEREARGIVKSPSAAERAPQSQTSLEWAEEFRAGPTDTLTDGAFLPKTI